MTAKEELIAKLYKGDCTKEELDRLLDILRQDEQNSAPEIMEQLWEQLHAYREIEEPAASTIVSRTLSLIEEKEVEERSKKKGSATVKRMALRRRQFVQTAAAVILLLISAFSWFWFKTDPPVIIRTAYAEQKTVQLPDRSTVKLNANSSISFHEKWDGEETRRVWLEGEAHFEVRKNQRTGQKFQVITKDLTVEVLGTVFNVNAREADTEVYLEEGKVQLDLQEQKEAITMEPGELVTYSRSSGKPEKKRIEKGAPSSWKDGAALMEDALLKDIVQKIEEIYGVTVVVENKAHLQREFSLGIPVDNPETGYLLLRELTGLDIEKVDGKWIIR
jgi:ferric-dicitrate binding protein FerR (iron transport regulator)